MKRAEDITELPEETRRIVEEMLADPEFRVRTIIANNWPDVRDNMASEGIRAAGKKEAADKVLDLVDQGKAGTVEKLLSVPWKFDKMGEEYDEAARYLIQKGNTDSGATILSAESDPSSGTSSSQFIGSAISGVTSLVGTVIKSSQTGGDRYLRPDWAKEEKEGPNYLGYAIGAAAFIVMILLLIYFFG